MRKAWGKLCYENICSRSTLTLLITASWAIISMMVNQIPMFSALSATALLVSQTNFWASSLISTQLLSNANSGARGKAATKIVMKPNCRTRNEIITRLYQYLDQSTHL